MFLPARITFVVGATLFAFAVFGAFFAASAMQSAQVMLGCFVQGYVGLWLMLATTSSARGSYADDQMLRRLFLMVGLVVTVIVASLYIGNQQIMAMVNLLLVLSGFVVTRDFLRFLDRSR